MSACACGSFHFCACLPDPASLIPGAEVLACFAAPRRLDTRGSYGGGVTWRARVVRVDTTRTGTWVTVEAQGQRRRVLLKNLRAVEGEVASRGDRGVVR